MQRFEMCTNEDNRMNMVNKPGNQIFEGSPTIFSPPGPSPPIIGTKRKKTAIF